MTLAVIALCAAVAALVVVLVLLLSSMRRLRHTTDQRVSSAVGDLNARMEAMVSELQGALARANDEGRRSRFLGELTSSLDLDEVLDRSLDAALSVSGADAALLSIGEPNGTPVIATLGLSTEEAEHQAVVGPPDGRELRSIGITYRYSDVELERSADLIHGGVAVP